MARHTPGPWTYQPEERDGEPAAAPSFFTIHAPHYFADVHVLVGEPGWARAEADARLIAAAPELLEALRWIAVLSPDHPPPGILPMAWRAALNAASAVIAKATGEAA